MRSSGSENLSENPDVEHSFRLFENCNVSQAETSAIMRQQGRADRGKL